MTKKFLNDQEINLNENDFLKTKVYANNLVKIIKNTESNKVFTIGLYGSWGSGKSSIIETAKKEFDQSKEKFITYDAWQYSNDSFRRMFLRTLSKELNYSETDFMKKFYENESRDVDNEFKLSYTKSVIVLIGLLLILVILSFIDFKTENKISIFSIITVLGTLTALFSGVFHQLKISVTKPYVFAPEQFEDCFKEIASKALKKNSLRDKFKYLNNLDFSIKDLNKLVIVIDNIDRCNSEIAYQLLTDVKTFLGSQKFSIVFIIPVDDKALLKHLFLKSNSILHNEKEEFLRKIFNVTLRIKPFNSTDMFHFTKSICVKNDLNFKNETVNIIGKEYSSNPRRVIQLINNLIVELNGYDEQFVKNHETLICCILIIREEYPKFYEEIYPNASLLINYNTNIEERKDQEHHRFMRIASTEFQHSSNSDINKILMNSNYHFENLSNDLKDMIDTFDLINLNTYLKDSVDISDEFFSYLSHKIDEAHDNDLKKDLSKYIQFFGIVQKNRTTPTQYVFKIFEKFRSKIEDTFFYAEDIETLMKLVEFQDYNYPKYKIKQSLINIMTSRINSTENYTKIKWIEIFNSLIKNLSDDETSYLIKSDYERLYEELIKVDKIKDSQFKILVTDNFLEKRSKELNSLEIEDKNYNDLKVILARHENKLLVLDTIFNRFNSDNLFKNSLDSRILYVEMFNNFIEYSKEIFKDYNGKNLEKNLETIFGEIDVIDDKVQIQNKKTLISLIERDSDTLNFLLQLIKNYYDFTKNENVIYKYLVELYDKEPHGVREVIVYLLNEKKNINDYYNLIYTSFDYADDNLVKLLKYFLTHPDKKFQDENKSISEKVIRSFSIELEDEDYKVKINDFFEFVINNTKSSELIFKVLNDELIKNRTTFLKFLNNNLKKMFAKNIILDDFSKIYNEDYLSFCFEVDDDTLNQKVLILISEKSFSLSIFDNLITHLIKFFKTNESKKLTKLLVNNIIERIETASSSYKSSMQMRQIKNKLESIKYLR